MKVLIVFLSAAVFIGSSSPRGANDGAIRDDVPDEKYLALAQEPQFANAGLILKAGTPNASAVLISPKWVLTAGHEVIDGDPLEFSLQFESDIYPVAEIMVYPNYQQAGLLGHNGDLALMRLSTPVTGITPANLYRDREELGLTGTTVGFGRSGAGASIITSPTPVGTKRAGQNVIDAIGGEIDGRVIPENLLVSDFDHPRNPELNRIGESDPLDLEYCPVGGDSGGGLYVQVHGDWYVAGLVSAFTPKINDDIDLGLAGSLIYWTRLSDYVTWIDSVVEE